MKMRFFLFLLISLFVFGCMKTTEDHWVKEINDANIPHPEDEKIDESNSGSSQDQFYIVTLELDYNVRFLQNEILELAVVLPKGSVLHILKGTHPVNYLFRDAQGQLSRSSNGFYGHVKIISAPPCSWDSWTPERLNELNGIGLYISASLVNHDVSGDIAPISESEPGEGYLLNFNPQGRPKFSYSDYFKKRFGAQLNRSISLNELSPRDQSKWLTIYNELKAMGNRTVSTPSEYLFMESEEEAKRLSEVFEKTGTSQRMGAWTIAVKGTAVRHGFPNVPCAEFMSESIRQAYTRAGYLITEDFNNNIGNYLIWHNTAAVVNLANALHRAGWIPWEAYHFKAPIGAIMMHYKATTPGHTYMAAGDDGRIIVDNGSPRGRDLRITSDKTIKMMFMSGVFFLPPGMIPDSW